MHVILRIHFTSISGQSEIWRQTRSFDACHFDLNCLKVPIKSKRRWNGYAISWD